MQKGKIKSPTFFPPYTKTPILCYNLDWISSTISLSHPEYQAFAQTFHQMVI